MVQAPHDGRVFSSMYESLHTNLSRRVMSFSDTPFGEEDTQHGEDFAHHSAVLAYLERYAVKFGLSECIRFRHSVEQVEREEVPVAPLVRDLCFSLFSYGVYIE